MTVSLSVESSGADIHNFGSTATFWHLGQVEETQCDLSLTVILQPNVGVGLHKLIFEVQIA